MLPPSNNSASLVLVNYPCIVENRPKNNSLYLLFKQRCVAFEKVFLIYTKIRERNNELQQLECLYTIYVVHLGKKSMISAKIQDIQDFGKVNKHLNTGEYTFQDSHNSTLKDKNL